MAKKAEQDDNYTEATQTEEELPKITLETINVSIAELNYYQQLSNQRAQIEAQISEATKSILESRGFNYEKVLQPVSLSEDGTKLTFNLSE